MKCETLVNNQKSSSSYQTKITRVCTTYINPPLPRLNHERNLSPRLHTSDSKMHPSRTNHGSRNPTTPIRSTETRSSCGTTGVAAHTDTNAGSSKQPPGSGGAGATGHVHNHISATSPYPFPAHTPPSRSFQEKRSFLSPVLAQAVKRRKQERAIVEQSFKQDAVTTGNVFTEEVESSIAFSKAVKAELCLGECATKEKEEDVKASKAKNSDIVQACVVQVQTFKTEEARLLTLEKNKLSAVENRRAQLLAQLAVEDREVDAARQTFDTSTEDIKADIRELIREENEASDGLISIAKATTATNERELVASQTKLRQIASNDVPAALRLLTRNMADGRIRDDPSLTAKVEKEIKDLQSFQSIHVDRKELRWCDNFINIGIDEVQDLFDLSTRAAVEKLPTVSEDEGLFVDKLRV